MWNSKNKVQLSPKLRFGVGRGIYTKQRILKYAGIICLLLAAVVTVHGLRIILGSSDSAPKPEGQVLGATDTPPPAREEVISFKEYTVQKGDTLFNIAQQINVPWTMLMELNNLKTTVLKPGQVLKIPNTN